MKNEIQVGDKVKWKGFPNRVYTVLEIKKDRQYLVTHPTMIFPKSGMLLNYDKIIQLVQERDLLKTKEEMIERLHEIGIKRMSLRRQMGKLKEELKALEKEFKETDKELFDIRSSKEYEEYARSDSN
jgi:Mg2+ and Co2+ transporter CorA